MSKRNPFIPVAEAALSVVLDTDAPVTPRSMHEVMEADVVFVYAQLRAFDVEQGIKALRVRAVDYVLREYGPAINGGRDAEHVVEHTPETMVRRMALLEQQKAQLDRSLAGLRAEYAQMTLAGDLQIVEATQAT
jgi:hypothetical protein